MDKKHTTNPRQIPNPAVLQTPQKCLLCCSNGGGLVRFEQCLFRHLLTHEEQQTIVPLGAKNFQNFFPTRV